MLKTSQVHRSGAAEKSARDSERSKEWGRASVWGLRSKQFRGMKGFMVLLVVLLPCAADGQGRKSKWDAPKEVFDAEAMQIDFM